MKRVIIVQARMTSTRLPGKILMNVGGRSMLSQQVRRLKHCLSADEIVIATTTNHGDDPVVSLARAENVRWYRGSEEDVLGRYAGAAREAQADVILRVTSDCPLIDPAETDRVVNELTSHASECDYASNVIHRTFPRGLDSEAFFDDVLERCDRLGTSASAREHVTHFILAERRALFVLRSVSDGEDNSALRWTVDTPEDLALVRKLYEDLGIGDRLVPWREVLTYVRKNHELMKLNSQIVQKSP